MLPIHALAATFAAAIAAALSPAPSVAEAWPQRTVRIIVPLPPGSSTDIVARDCAERLTARWGKPVVVENRPGGDGIPAVMGVVGARDGHTLLFSFAGIITINPLVHEKLPYDPARDLVPIVSFADSFLAIAVSNTLNVTTLAEFVTLARMQPGKLNWAATPGLPHYVFAAMQKSTGIELIRASYREFAPALADLGEGRIHAAASSVTILAPPVQAGRARLLMVTNRERSPLAPDVPTAAEAGYPELTFEGVVGLYGARDMPADLRDRIASDVAAVSSDPALATRLASMGAALRVGTPAEFAAAIEDQRAKVAAIAGVSKPKQ
jgi:tripartite-type tricarboxylate transporter receptor subunit TctC